MLFQVVSNCFRCFVYFFNLQWFTSFEDVLKFIGVFAKFKGVFFGGEEGCSVFLGRSRKFCRLDWVVQVRCDDRFGL